MDFEKDENIEEEKPKYVPRPKFQLVIAWTLAALVAIGVCLQYYWMMNT